MCYCHLPTDGEEPINEREMNGSVKKKAKNKVLGEYFLLMKFCDWLIMKLQLIKLEMGFWSGLL